MTDPDNALLQLATLHGLETQWHDFLGRHRQVGLGTLRALLRAGGVDASDPVGLLAHEIEAARHAPLRRC